MKPVALVIGGSGAIGASISGRLCANGYEVWTTSREATGSRTIALDADSPATYANVTTVPPCSAVVWAQGINSNDSIVDVDIDVMRRVVDVNTTLVIATMHELVASGRLLDGAKLCVISSVWQQVTRRNKLSYTVSKAALDGVVRSAAADLAARNIMVNAVLPGVLDTPMTRSMLTPAQISSFENATGFGRLVTLDDVTNTVAFLCSQLNTGITGQSISVDLGFGHERGL